MFKLSYNIISAFGVLIGLANIGLIFLIYGANNQSDIYFISMGIINVFYLLYHSLIEQFQINLRKRIERKKELSGFINTSVIFTTFFSLVITALLLNFGEIIVNIFSSDLDEIRKQGVVGFLNVLIFALFVYIPWQLYMMVLSAHDYIGVGYILTFFPGLFQTMMLGYMYFFENNDIGLLANSYVLGMGVAVLVSIFLTIKLTEYKLNKYIDARFIKTTIIQSVKIKSAHNVHNVFLGWAIPFYLSAYGSGVPSLFYYAKRIAETMLSIIYVPTHKILTNKLVVFVREKRVAEINAILRKANIVFPIMFFVAFVLFYGLVIVATKFELLTILNDKDIKVLIWLAAILLLASTVISTELIYSIINQISVSYYTILISNLGFVSLFLISISLIDLDVYSIAIAILIGQLSNFLINRWRARQHIEKMSG